MKVEFMGDRALIQAEQDRDYRIVNLRVMVSCFPQVSRP